MTDHNGSPTTERRQQTEPTTTTEDTPSGINTDESKHTDESTMVKLEAKVELHSESTHTTPTIADLKQQNGLTDKQLDTEVSEQNLYILADSFDNYKQYIDKLGLSPHEREDLKKIEYTEDHQISYERSFETVA